MYGDSNGNKVPVTDEGAYVYDEETYSCKCRYDAGKTILTPNRLASPYDFAKVLRSDNLQNTALYESYTEQEITEEFDYAFPLSYTDAEGACKGFTSTLVSFISPDEYDVYLNESSSVTADHFNKQPTVFLDLGMDADTNLRWTVRNEVVQYCTATVSGECGTEITEICDDADLCDAYNFNNLAYEKAEPAFLTDGYNQTHTHASVDVTIPITLAPNGATVELWSWDPTPATFPFSVF
jgi:hypothetical protein